MSITVIPKPNRVRLLGGARRLSPQAFTFLNDESLPPEGYTLTVTATDAVITFSTAAGKFYALQTLAQLQRADGTVPLVQIEDAPRFSFRAFMIDSARHIQTPDEIKAYIEAAARFKFNVFHWHLCDDQGWRIESERYPALHQVGAFRNAWGFGSSNTARYGGFYTKAEIRDIVRFCEERFITVIPEVDIPGHTTAVLATYPALSCRERPLPVQTKAGIFKDILCAGKEATFDFCFGILEEIIDLFPGPFLHIGGDEAPKDRWEACDDCRARMQAEGLQNSEELQGYFTARIARFLQARGKTPIAWNESLRSGMLSNEVMVAEWMDKAQESEAFANRGGKMIVEDFFHYYLDYPYGMTPLRKTYNFEPLRKRLTAQGRANVLGVETPIWTEFVETFDRLCYQCFPRMMAVAETGWTAAEEKSLRDFKRRAEAQRPMLQALGIRMAPQQDWDPRGVARLGGIVAHYRTFINRETIHAWLHKEDAE